MNGNFLYKKLQEFDLFKKVFLDEKQLYLFKEILENKPGIYLKNEISKINSKENYFNLFPIPEIEDKTKLYKQEIEKKFIDTKKNNDKIVEKLIMIRKYLDN